KTWTYLTCPDAHQKILGTLYKFYVYPKKTQQNKNHQTKKPRIVQIPYKYFLQKYRREKCPQA
ncbi:MAG: hypothetical protein Q6363_002370, partial [Candidatus Njordarchaeota archaeon]